MVKIFGIFLITLLISCTSYNNKRMIKATVKDFMGTNIVLPDSLCLVSDGIITNIKSCNVIKNNNRAFVLMNGNCHKCLLSFKYWDDYFKTREKQIEHVWFFISYISEDMYVEYYLRDMDPRYKIVISEKSLLFDFNNIPEKELFHTFIVNKNNQVIFIGSPLLNDSFAEQYRLLLN